MIGQIEDIIGIAAKDAVLISAKTGLGVDELLERIVERIPAPRGSEHAPLQALIIDSWFDSYAADRLARARHERRNPQGRPHRRALDAAQVHRREGRRVHAAYGRASSSSRPAKWAS